MKKQGFPGPDPGSDVRSPKRKYHLSEIYILLQFKFTENQLKSIVNFLRKAGR